MIENNQAQNSNRRSSEAKRRQSELEKEDEDIVFADCFDEVTAF